MNILISIPEEVFHHDLFPKLDWNDLLRLRRVSHQSKFLADGYLKTHPDLAPEIEINEADKTMDKFLELGIPTTKIFLNNASGAEFYEKQPESILTFVFHLGPLITHLRVNKYSYLMAGVEWDFFDGLPNLTTFETENCTGGPYFQKSLCQQLDKKNEEEIRARGSDYPKIFKSIKKLSMDTDRSESPIFSFRTFIFRRFCENLEHLTLPFGAYNALVPSRSPDHTLDTAFRRLHHEIIRNDDNQGQPQLKCYDFKFHFTNDANSEFMTPAEVRMEEVAASNQFLDLCQTCVERHVKLKHVVGSWFQNITLPNAKPQLGRCVASLAYLHPCLDHIDLSHMEVLLILTSRSGVIGNSECRHWPALKELAIVVDSTKLKAVTLPQAPACRALFQCLFSNSSYLTLVQLVLKYTTYDENHYAPKTENIVSACPNLKILKIGKWPGTNKALVTLWRGLPGLEDISLEACSKLGNNAFVGEDVRDPVFFKLKGLKKLSLRGLDEMPKVTDTLFQLVIQHLGLTHLELSSASPVTNVTSSGIRALLQGKFARSI